MRASFAASNQSGKLASASFHETNASRLLTIRRFPTIHRDRTHRLIERTATGAQPRPP
jgi:hypothetical protein